MYCSNCGNKNEGNNYCINCGNKLINSNNNDNINVIKEDGSGLKTASIVLGILGIIGSLLIIFSPIAFIFSLIGLILGIIAAKKVRNVSGIVLNSIGLILSIIIVGVMILIFSFMFDNDRYDEIDRYDIEDNFIFDREYY